MLTFILGSKNRRPKYLEVLPSVYIGIPVVASVIGVGLGLAVGAGLGLGVGAGVGA